MPRLFAGSVVFILLTGATGIAFGALLHHTAATIVTYFALGARGPGGPGSVNHDPFGRI